LNDEIVIYEYGVSQVFLRKSSILSAVVYDGRVGPIGEAFGGRAVTDTSTEQPNRVVRRKARTRAALIRAAQRLIAEGRTQVPILEITQAADVGMGSFYNHFETKEELYAAAVEEVLDAYGELLDRVTADIEDPAEVFAASYRLAGRLHRREPELSKVLLSNALGLLNAPNGLAPRARRDIEAATRAGRFHVDDLDLAVTMAAGALIALGQLLHDQPDRDVDDAADRMTESLLRVFGLTARQAHQLCTRPLPDVEVGQDSGSAA